MQFIKDAEEHALIFPNTLALDPILVLARIETLLAIAKKSKHDNLLHLAGYFVDSKAL